MRERVSAVRVHSVGRVAAHRFDRQQHREQSGERAEPCVQRDGTHSGHFEQHLRDDRRRDAAHARHRAAQAESERAH